MDGADVKITLTLPERIQAATVGAQRQFQNIKNGRANTKGADESNSWQRHIEGAMAEMAVAKARGKFWFVSCCRHSSDSPAVSRA